MLPTIQMFMSYLIVYFFARAERDRVKQQAGDLERWLQNEIDKLTLKIKKT